MVLEVEGTELRNEYKNCKTIIDQYRLLNKVDDTMLQKICGSDAALYLVFLRYSALIFGGIAVLNLFFIVIFVTGSPLD
jgi:hypothetical protein